MKRTLSLQRAAAPVSWIVVGLCVLPLIAKADGAEPAAAQASHLDTLLTVHDVRNAIHAPRPQSSTCTHTQAERGR